MLLIDAMVDHGERSIACTAAIGPDHPFLEGDGESVDALLCLELVAQSVAAYAGYRDRLAGRPLRHGFLVSCREATFEVPALRLGDALRIETRHTWGDDLAGSFAGRVLRDGVSVAEVVVGVYRGSLDGALVGAES
jgi:predicted hotdog family 3-hydroxylacyl-ACP dehydratase